MAKSAQKINLQLLQDLINQLQESDEWSGEMPFFARVAEEYNKRKANEYKDINGPLIRLRKLSGLITTTIQTSKRGKSFGVKLSPEHIQKLNEGRKKRKTIPAFPPAKLNKLLERFKGDGSMISLINTFQKRPSFKQLMKITCLACMGGGKDGGAVAVKNCSSPLCPLWEVRGWK